jgi:surface antigen
MFNARVSVVRDLMVVGKLLILILINTPAHSNEITNPKFFDYKSNNILNRMVDFTFGWNKKLNDEQKEVYYQSIVHALEYTEDGQSVQWYKDNASGYTRPVMTWPISDGYCRRIHIEIIAFSKQRIKSFTSCYHNSNTNWTWYTDK